jgi:nucleoside 2-deoxyribosyltransferase
MIKEQLNIFIICSVRGTSDEYRKRLEHYVKTLEDIGHNVHLPHRDTNQNNSGFNICKENSNAIFNSDEIHIFYNSESQGTHFDMGVSFALNKKIVIVENEPLTEGKSFQRMLTEWENKY